MPLIGVAPLRLLEADDLDSATPVVQFVAIDQPHLSERVKPRPDSPVKVFIWEDFAFNLLRKVPEPALAIRATPKADEQQARPERQLGDLVIVEEIWPDQACSHGFSPQQGTFVGKAAHGLIAPTISGVKRYLTAPPNRR